MTLTDPDGNVYLDFSSCIATTNIGHSDPKVTEAIKKQIERILHASPSDFYSELPTKLAEKLVEITPGNFPKRVLFSNSGTEAIECAFKVARWHTGRIRMISFIGSFHGRTFGSLSLTGSRAHHFNKFSPLVPEVTHVPYAYCYQCAFKKEYPKCGLECINYIENTILKSICPPEELAGIVVEPILGEGGYVVPPSDFILELKRICEAHNLLLIFDEVQTGFGRTGKLFAAEHWKVEPDIICLAKAIANGFPMGATVCKSKIMDWIAGSHANTFGGNPVGCAASLATIESIISQRLWENSEKLGNYLLFRLNEFKEEFKSIGDVRGKGLMVGVELVKNKDTKEPAREERDLVLKHCFEKGLLLLPGGFSTLRFAPPLIITKEQIDTGLDILYQTFDSVAN